MQNLGAPSCSFHTLKRCAWYDTNMCTADCRDILYHTTVILAPNIKDFQSFLILKGSTGTDFFKLIFWYDFLVIFLFPFLLALKSVLYFTDEETVGWCVTPSYISHVGSHY